MIAEKRSYDQANTADPCQQRVVLFCAGSQFQVAAMDQNQVKLANKKYKEEILKRDMELTSKINR